MSIDLEELEPGTRTDYRRANGAPQVVVDGKNERYSRPSSFADPLDDKSALTNWRIDRGCLGVALDRALQARWCALDVEDKKQNKVKTKLRDDSISAGRGAQAADIGTALHAMSVRFEQEPFFSPPEPYLSSLSAYETQMRLLGLRSILFEFHTVNIEYRCAGTADRLYELLLPLTVPDGSVLEAGTYVIGDLKTGSKFEYSMPSYAVQEFLYAAGQLYNVETDEFEATPDINQKWGLIAHMPADESGRCEFLWVDLEIGAFGAYIVQQVKLWRRNWRAGEFEFSLATLAGPQPTTIGLTVDDEPVVEPVTTTDPPIEVPPDDRLIDEEAASHAAILEREKLAELIEWAKLRLSYISQHEGASKLLIRMWPAGLRTPKQGIETIEEAEAVNALLSQVEAEFTLTFVEGGPQSVGPRSTRRKGK